MGFERFNDALRRLRNFCLRLGGRVEEVKFESEFGCDVDPRRVISEFEVFKRLIEEAKGSGVERIYFGEHDAYFFAYPGEGEAGFVLTYDTEELSEEEASRLQEELETSFYDFMYGRGLPPEFRFIPRVEYGGDYLDVEARVPIEWEDFDKLDDIARAMLEFKPKLHELLKKYGVRAKIYTRFM